MLKLIIKILLFVVGISIFIMALSLIPLDMFTFRHWESVIWKENRATIGKFYPDKMLSRDESGDLGHNSSYNIIKKNIFWETDKYGFRNDNNKSDNYDIVLVGDSNSVGSGVTQELILSNQISKKVRRSRVFNYSPMDIDVNFLNNLVDMDVHPKIVIYQKIEREIPNILNINDNDLYFNSKYTFKRKIINKLKFFSSNKIILYLLLAMDRFIKTEPFNFIQGKVDATFGKFNMPVTVGAENVLFYDKSFFCKEIESEQVKIIADKIEKLSTAFSKKGIEFIFLPVPNKESIYIDLLPKDKLPLKGKDLLTNLKKQLDARGVRSIDTYALFRSSFQAGNRMYFSDDTHWNSTGIKLATDLIAKELSNESNVSNM